MLLTSNSSSQPVLVNRTNLQAQKESSGCSVSQLLNSPADRKRPSIDLDGRQKKRVKVPLKTRENDIASQECESDDDIVDDSVVRDRARKRTAFALRDSAMMAAAGSRGLPSFSTRPILETFVSSSKTDLYRFHPDDARSFMTIPYCLSYTHEAKRGGTSLLAVATDQGSVHVVNTSRRQNWDCEPQRESFIAHANSIFDVQWSPSDTLLATASGDRTVGILTLESSVSPENRVIRVLEGHSSTVKCVVWEPSRDGDILCSGSRDGTIRVWDLRTECRAGSDGRSGAAIMVLGAHGPEGQKPKRRRGMSIHTPRSVTGIAYADGDPYRLISSGSCDGILRQWDLRQTRGKELQFNGWTTTPLCVSSVDPTTLQGTRRPRGITSIVPGRGPTAGLLFALGTDSRIHTYSLPSLDPLSGYVEAQDPWTYTHPDMQTNSFYVHLALSPCGRWLANGNACDGRVFLFDVGNAASSRHARSGGAPPAVQLRGHVREAGSLDWADGMLATSSEDTTVRVWRPDMEVSRKCHDDNEEMGWEWSWATN